MLKNFKEILENKTIFKRNARILITNFLNYKYFIYNKNYNIQLNDLKKIT